MNSPGVVPLETKGPDDEHYDKDIGKFIHSISFSCRETIKFRLRNFHYKRP